MDFKCFFAIPRIGVLANDHKNVTKSREKIH